MRNNRGVEEMEQEPTFPHDRHGQAARETEEDKMKEEQGE